MRPSRKSSRWMDRRPAVAAEAKLRLGPEHPGDLLICHAVRLDMDDRRDALPDEHSFIAGENAEPDF